jgi:hypothetical protein
MPATLTKNPRTGNGKNAPVVTKRTKPSKPGTIVDTAAASVIRDEQDRAEAVLSMNDDHEAKTKGHKFQGVAQKQAAKIVAASKAKTQAIKKGSSVHRLTTEWTGKDKKDVAVKDRVKTSDGITLDVIGRWTRKTKAGKLIPCITGHIVSFGSVKGDPTEGGKGKTIGDRLNAAAAEVTHVTKK